jgi:hypothetical protein
MAKKRPQRGRHVSDGLPRFTTFSLGDDDRRALARVYTKAGQGPDFRADNEAVERDFAMLDHDTDALLA